MDTTRALTLFLALALLALVLLALSAPTARAAPVVVRVTTSGTTTWPCGDQSNWSNPCALQTALGYAGSSTELWVASGTYTPTADANRFATFQLRDGIALYGGFATTETLRSQRNFTANVTILSGDIGTPGNISDNAYHVVTGSWVTYTAVLDGFTVTGGKADGPNPDDRGAGMYNSEGSPTLANVTFSGNSAAFDGGGMHNYYGSPTLTNVTFISNTATSAGGMYNANSSPTLTNVTFISNTATSGGGVFNSNSSPTLMNITFVSNFAGWGGGMHNTGSSNPTVTNTTFVSNTASAYGGGMYNMSGNPSLTNVTFSGNSAGSGGGGMFNIQSNPSVRNTIIWGNTAPTSSQIYNDLSTPSLSDSVVQGGYAGGTRIITADPRLGALGHYGGPTQTIPLRGGSSAIDAGNDATCADADQRGVPRPQGARCDIGAFESMLMYLPLIKK